MNPREVLDVFGDGKCLLLQPGFEPRLLSLAARSLPIPTTLCRLLRIGMAIMERGHRYVKGVDAYNNQTLASFSNLRIFSVDLLVLIII